MENGPVRILLVEDNPGDARLWRELLLEQKDLSFKFHHVERLHDALEALRTEVPDVVLLDLSLPDAVGVESVIRMHRAAPSVPLVVLTGLNDQETALNALKNGAQDYLVKDRVDGRALWHSIRYAIERNKVDEMERQLLGAETARAHAEVGERRFRSLAEAIPQIVWEIDADNKFEYLSSRWFDYTGQTMSNYSALNTTDWIHPEDVERCMTAWTEAQREHKPWQVEYRLRRADGEYRWHLGRSVPLVDGKGIVIKWYGTATDIDDQRRAAEERQRLYEQAQRAVKSRDDLLATVSHDLRNPLENILMSAALLKEIPGEVVDPKLTKKVAIIERAARRMEHLIRDLLDIASIESGHLAVKPEAFTVAGLLSDAVEALTLTAQEKSVRIETRLEPVAAKVSCDRNRMVQVFTNLVGNAIRFTPAGSAIIIAAGPHGDQEALFSVADAGPGIQADQLPHVFDRFWRADETSRAGLGLGLAICRGIIESHRGRIWVESQRGVGTTFFFTLPLV